MNYHDKWLRQVAEGLHKQALYSWANTCTEAADEIAKLERQKENLIRALEAQQAKIDALMLEFCPGEMSAAQRAEYAKAQSTALETRDARGKREST